MAVPKKKMSKSKSRSRRASAWTVGTTARSASSPGLAMGPGGSSVIHTQPPTPEEGHGPVDVQQFPVFITVAEGDIEVEAECWFEDPDMAAEYTDTQFRRFLPDNPTSTITVGRAGCPFGHPYLAGLEFGATYSWEITDGELVAVSESRGTISMARP